MYSHLLQISKFSFVRIIVVVLGAVLILTTLPGRVMAQQNAASSPAANSVPQIIQFSGQLNERSGGAAIPAGTASVTFTLYENEQGGTALWSETQNVQVDAQGHYTALLGSTSPSGLPMNLFTTVQAHWLAVQPLSRGVAEQPRVLLVSAPYALKAGDAETIGGLPPSAFVRVDAPSGTSGTIAGTSAGTTTVVTTASKGSAHANPVRLTTTQCGDFCNANLGYAIGEAVVVATPGGAGSGNTALGVQALFNNPTGNNNTASGETALLFNTTGSNNTASGGTALYSNTTGSDNTASGYQALYSNTTASYNTASGYQALYSNIGGDNEENGSANTATGYQALYSNTMGEYNTANGYQALFSNTIGGSGSYSSANTGVGYQALYNDTTGNGNTAIGYQALYTFNDTGYSLDYNTAIGEAALYSDTTGSNNIAIGYDAASSVSGGNGNNIEIGNQGVSTDSGAIRIGCTSDSTCPYPYGSQTAFYAAGISGVNVSGATVIVSSSVQLGVASSSRRYKEDIRDMGGTSEGLMRLRPVTFRYKHPFDDVSKPIQYGLIAEEVAEVYPDLVARSADGQIETVKYQVLDPMLLNELQRQQGEIRDQKALVLAQQNQLKAQQALLKTQQAQIAELVSNVKIIEASLRTRRGRGHARLASAKATPTSVATVASLPLASATRGGN